MRTWPPALLLLFGLLIVLAATTENVGIDSPGELYDAIDGLQPVDEQPIGRASVGVRYGLYWLATAAGIVLAATLLRWAVRLVLLSVPNVMWATARWYDRGERRALELTGEQHLARSMLAARHPEREQLPARDRIRLRRAVRLQGEVPVPTIRWWVWRKRACDRFEDAVLTVTGWFGARFSRIGGWSTAFPLPLIVVSTAFVLAGRPIRDQSARAEQAVDDVWAAITTAEFGRLLPLALLVLGVLAVTRRGPLIDRIRARDDAARDANRMLGELHGRLLRLYYAMYDWRRELERSRWSLVGRWVDHTSAKRYEWQLRGGIRATAAGRHHDIRRRDVEPPWATDRHRELEEACEGLAEIVQRINDAGLHHVALRLASRVVRPMNDLGLVDVSPSAERIRRRVSTPSALGSDWTDRLRAQRPDSSDAAGLEYYEATLEDQAFVRARRVDMALAELYASERRVVEVLDHLTSRVIGTFWTQVLGVVAK